MPCRKGSGSGGIGQEIQFLHRAVVGDAFGRGRVGIVWPGAFQWQAEFPACPLGAMLHFAGEAQAGALDPASPNFEP